MMGRKLTPHETRNAIVRTSIGVGALLQKTATYGYAVPCGIDSANPVAKNDEGMDEKCCGYVLRGQRDSVHQNPVYVDHIWTSSTFVCTERELMCFLHFIFGAHTRKMVTPLQFYRYNRHT